MSGTCSSYSVSSHSIRDILFWVHKTECNCVVCLFCQLGCLFPIAVMLLLCVDLVHGILKASERLLDYFGQTRGVSDKVGHLIPAVLQFNHISSQEYVCANQMVIFRVQTVCIEAQYISLVTEL